MGTDKISKAFFTFHEKNPQVYTELVKLAREARDKGLKNVGISLLWEVLRWNNLMKADGAAIKLQNNFRSRYARLIMAQEPDLAGLFKVAKLRNVKKDEAVEALPEPVKIDAPLRPSQDSIYQHNDPSGRTPPSNTYFTNDPQYVEKVLNRHADEINALLDRREKIEAIKLLRSVGTFPHNGGSCIISLNAAKIVIDYHASKREAFGSQAGAA